jgi:hypothetical protein
MSLIDFKLSDDMKSVSDFNGVATNQFFGGISKGIVRIIKELTTVVVVCSGNAGSPGSAFLQGVPSSSQSGLNPIMTISLRSNRIGGVALQIMSRAFSMIGSDLRTDAVTSISSVPGVSNGIGVISSGGISFDGSRALSVLKEEIVRAGIHDSDRNPTSATSAILKSIAEALRGYLLTFSYQIPIIGGSPTVGTASVTLSGRYLS